MFCRPVPGPACLPCGPRPGGICALTQADPIPHARRPSSFLRASSIKFSGDYPRSRRDDTDSADTLSVCTRGQKRADITQETSPRPQREVEETTERIRGGRSKRTGISDFSHKTNGFIYDARTINTSTHRPQKRSPI